PKLILIEGPHEANDLIPHLLDAKTQPPIAIYSSYRDDNNVLGMAGTASPSADIPPRFSCWYPLLACSPEYIALKTANKGGAQVLFMDLPHHALIKPAAQSEPIPAAAEDVSGSKPPAARKIEFETEKLIVESRFYQRLAEVAGYRSWNEGWDSLFESR